MNDQGKTILRLRAEAGDLRDEVKRLQGATMAVANIYEETQRSLHSAVEALLVSALEGNVQRPDKARMWAAVALDCTKNIETQLRQLIAALDQQQDRNKEQDNGKG